MTIMDAKDLIFYHSSYTTLSSAICANCFDARPRIIHKHRRQHPKSAHLIIHLPNILSRIDNAYPTEPPSLVHTQNRKPSISNVKMT